MGNELSCSDGRPCQTDALLSCLESRSGQMPGMVQLAPQDGKVGGGLAWGHSGAARPHRDPAFTSAYGHRGGDGAPDPHGHRAGPSGHAAALAGGSPGSEPHRGLDHSPHAAISDSSVPPFTAEPSGRGERPSAPPRVGSLRGAGGRGGGGDGSPASDGGTRPAPLAPSGPTDQSLDSDTALSPAWNAEGGGGAVQKAGWIQMSITISDMSIARWTQGRQDAFIETVAMTTRVPLSDICVLSLKEKCGRRLLSNAVEVTFQAKASSPEHASAIVNELNSETLDQMMLQANFRLRHDISRKVENPNVGGGGLAAQDNKGSGPFNTPFRNGYSLRPLYERQLRHGENGEQGDVSAGADGGGEFKRHLKTIENSMLL